jgi:Asp-tRNA(Asn)/Glu-tRNA(Gln) amidotransferase A subunit family amidase
MGRDGGFPTMNVPAGFTSHVFDRDADGKLVGPVPAKLPVSITFAGPHFGEPTLIKLASAYEASTKHRTPPPDFGPLP